MLEQFKADVDSVLFGTAVNAISTREAAAIIGTVGFNFIKRRIT